VACREIVYRRKFFFIQHNLQARQKDGTGKPMRSQDYGVFDTDVLE
jgi:hypothetical protein